MAYTVAAFRLRAPRPNQSQSAPDFFDSNDLTGGVKFCGLGAGARFVNGDIVSFGIAAAPTTGCGECFTGDKPPELASVKLSENALLCVLNTN